MAYSLMLIVACLTATQTKAQSVVSENIHEEETQKNENESKVKRLNSGIEFEYLAIEKGFGLGVNLVFKNILVSFVSTSGDSNNNVKNISGWNLGAGYNYRHYFTNFLYIEGRAGVGYYHGSYEYRVESSKTRYTPSQHGKNNTTSTKWEKESNGEFGVFISPRIGIKLFKLWGSDLSAVAGYRWDFQKFKFNKENTADNFTIGLSFTY